MAFYSAYPNASVKDLWKALKIKDGLNNLLDEAASQIVQTQNHNRKIIPGYSFMDCKCNTES
jgi:hypothetical protein